MPNAEPLAQCARDRRKRVAARQTLRAFDVGCKVAVAKPEPGRAAEFLEGLHERPGLAGLPPAGRGVGDPREGVHHGVQVGRNAQAQVLEVVARIHADRQFPWAERARQAIGQFGAPHAAGERDDHRKRSLCRGR